MKASFRTLVLLAIVLTLVALPSVVMAAGGQSLTDTVATMFGSAIDSDHGHRPRLPIRRVVLFRIRRRPQTPAPATTTAAPARLTDAYPTSGDTAATLGTYKIVKVIGDRLSSTIYAYTDNNWLYRSDFDGSGWYLVVTDPAVDDFLMSASDPNVLYSGQGQDCGGSGDGDGPDVQVVGRRRDLDGAAFRPQPEADADRPGQLGSRVRCRLHDAVSFDGWRPDVGTQAGCGCRHLWQTYTLADMASGSLVGSPQPTTPHWDQIFAVGNDLQDAGMVAFTGDQGTTWADITDPQDPPVDASAVVASLSEGGKLWVASSKGVWCDSLTTTSTGACRNQGLQYLVKTNARFNDLTYANNGNLYLATNKGLYMQSDPNGVWKMPDADDVDFGTRRNVQLVDHRVEPHPALD